MSHKKSADLFREAKEWVAHKCNSEHMTRSAVLNDYGCPPLEEALAAAELKAWNGALQLIKDKTFYSPTKINQLPNPPCEFVRELCDSLKKEKQK